MSASRPELRTLYRTQRNNLSVNERLPAQKNIAHQLKQHPRVKSSTCIAAYWATDGEVDLAEWMMGQTQVTVTLPRMGSNKTMQFYRLDATDTLVRNQFGILEPGATAQLISSQEISVMLVPLVSFDAMGNRLGRGGGYYDRFLSALAPRPYLVGVGFACQQHPKLTEQTWDVRMDAVVTENAFMEFN